MICGFACGNQLDIGIYLVFGIELHSFVGPVAIDRVVHFTEMFPIKRFAGLRVSKGKVGINGTQT